MKSVLITQTEAHFHLATLQCTHTYAHTLTHTLTHTCMTSPVSQKLKTLSTSAWTRCGFQVAGWMPMSAGSSTATHVCLCVCVQVLLLLLLLCMQANGMRCLRFVSVSANKEKLPTSQIEAPRGLWLSVRPVSLWLVALLPRFVRCSGNDIWFMQRGRHHVARFKVGFPANPRDRALETGKLICTSCYWLQLLIWFCLHLTLGRARLSGTVPCRLPPACPFASPGHPFPTAICILLISG